MSIVRKSIEVPGMGHHQTPIPTGTRIGNMVFSSGINGADPSTGKVPKDDPQKQAEFLFENIRKFMSAAGGTPEHIAHVTVFLKDDSYRNMINQYWVEMFPEPSSRPARHALTLDLRGDMLLQAELIAVIQD
jgi:2-iminobutanoate/2-iminopropanoate deaminase